MVMYILMTYTKYPLRTLINLIKVIHIPIDIALLIYLWFSISLTLYSYSILSLISIFFSNFYVF
jgi:hypothetical protein